MNLETNQMPFQGRIIILIGVMVLAFGLVLAGYYRVQVLNQERYEALGEKRRIKTARVKPTRGLIYDRNGRLITQNMPTYNLILQRDEMQEPWRLFKQRISAFFGITVEELDKRYSKRSSLLSRPILLREDIGFEESMRVKRHQVRFPGLVIETAEKRFYPHAELFTHMLGYVGEASPEQLARNDKLQMGDIMGKNGLELTYNHLLQGESGRRLIQIDSRGVYRSVTLEKPQTPGKDLHLTIDFDLQKLAYDELDGRTGSVVMMDVKTGEVLVYVSAPTYDSNLFVSGISQKNWDRLRNSPTKPFLNRPIQGTYAPGSIFKLITALAGLKHNKITPQTPVFCSGKINIYNRDFRCHNKFGHGWVDLSEAIQGSCNVYFYHLAEILRPEDLAQVASEMGFGQKTGIDLTGEKAGLLPTPAWKKRVTGEIWYPGDTLNISIGQGSLQATPLQGVQLMAMVANSGYTPQPHVLMQAKRNEETFKPQPTARTIEGIPQAFYGLIRQAMWRVVNDPNGTGKRAAVKGFDVSGKTGTAQLVTFTSDDDHDRDELVNAWFAGFAPRDEARVAIIVLVEQAGAGGSNAAPIAQKLLQAYFEQLKKVDPT